MSWFKAAPTCFRADAHVVSETSYVKLIIHDHFSRSLCGDIVDLKMFRWILATCIPVRKFILIHFIIVDNDVSFNGTKSHEHVQHDKYRRCMCVPWAAHIAPLISSINSSGVNNIRFCNFEIYYIVELYLHSIYTMYEQVHGQFQIYELIVELLLSKVTIGK